MCRDKAVPGDSGWADRLAAGAADAIIATASIAPSRARIDPIFSMALPMPYPSFL
jgi:hypothetical protein